MTMAPEQEEEKQEEPETTGEAMEEGGEDTPEKEEKEEEDKENKVNDKKLHMKVAADAPWKDRMWEVFTTFWPLGLVRTR